MSIAQMLGDVAREMVASSGDETLGEQQVSVTVEEMLGIFLALHICIYICWCVPCCLFCKSGPAFCREADDCTTLSHKPGRSSATRNVKEMLVIFRVVHYIGSYMYIYLLMCAVLFVLQTRTSFLSWGRRLCNVVAQARKIACKPR